MKKYFVSGLLILLPVTITFLIVNFFVNLLTQPFAHFTAFVLNLGGIQLQSYTNWINKIFILCFISAITLFIGAIGHKIIVRKLLKSTEWLLTKIPLVNTIYKASREVIHTVLGPSTPSFKNVVLVPYPDKNTKVIGFLIKETPETFELKTKSFLVFVPTTPNPTTGFIMMYEESDIHYTKISVEDALKFVISCGVIQPKTQL